jgi:hypothetical protein
VANTLEGWKVRDDRRDRRDSWSGGGRWDEQLRGCRLERLSDLSWINHVGSVFLVNLLVSILVLFLMLWNGGKRAFCSID